MRRPRGYGKIAASMLLCGILAAACVYGAAEALYAKMYASAQEASVREAESRLALFDLAIARVERDSLANGRAALIELGKRYGAAASVAAATEASLAAEAKALGVSNIYFIDPAGRVFATSFAPDLGLELFSISDEFAEFLRGQYGAGRIADQGLSESTLTGAVNSYQYYGPKGGAYLIEISTALGDAVSRSYPGMSYDGLVELAFGDAQGGKGREPLASIVDFIVARGISNWSLSQQGTARSKYASLVAAAMRGEEAIVRGRDATTMIKPIGLTGGAAFRDASYYAVFEIDRRPVLRFRLAALLSALAACAIAATVAFVTLSRSLEREAAARVERQRIDSMARTIAEKEEGLRAARRMETVGAMAGGLAHDFNNILTGISGTIECMELRIADGDGAPSLLELTSLASRTARRGGELVRSLLDIAAPKQAERRPVDLAAIAREAAELAGSDSREGVTVRVEAPNGPLIVSCDAQAVLRAALNLCVNGIQAMTTMRPEGEGRGGLLLVRSESRPAHGDGKSEAAILVRDEGVGIFPEDMDKVIAPFFSTKPRGFGTGLGLAIAVSVAESHGGRLEMESERGRGSTFAIVLPA